jgi:hypothetical protein
MYKKALQIAYYASIVVTLPLVALLALMVLGYVPSGLVNLLPGVATVALVSIVIGCVQYVAFYALETLKTRYFGTATLAPTTFPEAAWNVAGLSVVVYAGFGIITRSAVGATASQAFLLLVAVVLVAMGFAGYGMVIINKWASDKEARVAR